MKVEEFMRQIFEANRFKTDYNLMDREIVIQVGKLQDVEIEEISIDYTGNLCIVVEEPSEDEWYY